ncbi:unnamed protein product [Allacma fusca]|uniref:Uncharacterized protein n=1 Tax=Allacma fusca TaxID=39272 RepID=A0A8J2JZ67_9HEXA|nr:unnamed protein product [Allacma fusca]
MIVSPQGLVLMGFHCDGLMSSGSQMQLTPNQMHLGHVLGSSGGNVNSSVVQQHLHQLHHHPNLQQQQQQPPQQPQPPPQPTGTNSQPSLGPSPPSGPCPVPHPSTSNTNSSGHQPTPLTPTMNMLQPHPSLHPSVINASSNTPISNTPGPGPGGHDRQDSNMSAVNSDLDRAFFRMFVRFYRTLSLEKYP